MEALAKSRERYLKRFKCEGTEFIRLIKNPANRLTDNDVHRLRVLTRRLRSPLTLFKESSQKSQLEPARKKLKAMGGLLGDRRKWDVARSYAQAFGCERGKIQLGRKKAQERLERKLKKKLVQSLSKELTAALHALEKIPAKEIAPALQFAKKALSKVKKAPPQTKTARHKTRIKMKKMRYLIESFGLRSPSLEKLQSALGREHDLDFLQSVTGRKRRIQNEERRCGKEATKLYGPALRSAKKGMELLLNRSLYR